MLLDEDKILPDLALIAKLRKYGVFDTLFYENLVFTCSGSLKE